MDSLSYISYAQADPHSELYIDNLRSLLGMWSIWEVIHWVDCKIVLLIKANVGRIARRMLHGVIEWRVCEEEC